MKSIASNNWTSGQPAGYWLKRKNLFLGHYLTKGGQYPDPVIRFFRRGHGRHPEKSVHEQIEIKGRLGWLKNDLIHLATPNFSRYLIRENRYSTLAAYDLKAVRVRIFWFNWLNYLLFKPFLTFVNIFFRHRGYVDGFPGFVFALFSGIHHSLAFIKYRELTMSRHD
jgi:hypothetical protein